MSVNPGVYSLLRAFSEIWPNSDWGPLHILISDQNVLDEDLASCRTRTLGFMAGDPEYTSSVPHSTEELRASLLLLDMLALIPEDVRFGDIEDEPRMGDLE